MNPEENGIENEKSDNDTTKEPCRGADVPHPPHTVQSPADKDNLELTRLQVKLQSTENKNLAMSMELKCAQMQVSAGEQLNEKRQELINMLEEKVKKLVEDKTKLLNMVEELLKEKTRYTAKLNQAAATLENLTDKFIKSEKTKRDLQNQINSHLMPPAPNATGQQKTSNADEGQNAAQNPNLDQCRVENQGQNIGQGHDENLGRNQTTGLEDKKASDITDQNQVAPT